MWFVDESGTVFAILSNINEDVPGEGRAVDCRGLALDYEVSSLLVCCSWGSLTTTAVGGS